MSRPRRIRVDQSLVLVVEGAEETPASIEQGTAYQFEPFAAQAAPVNALLALEGHLEVATPVRHREALGGLHAALQDFIPLHLQGHLFVVITGMELPHLVVEKILLILERLRAADVLQQKMCECGRNNIPILRCQLDLGLCPIVDDENWTMQLGDQLRQKVELGRGTQPEGGDPLWNEFEYHLLDGHLEDQRVLSPRLSWDSIEAPG